MTATAMTTPEPVAEAGGAPLLPCPFCGGPLRHSSRKVNPSARCVTEGCYGNKIPVVNLDVPSDVEAWNTRTAPATSAPAMKRPCPDDPGLQQDPIDQVEEELFGTPAPATKDVQLEPGWLARDVKRATEKVAEWEAAAGASAPADRPDTIAPLAGQLCTSGPPSERKLAWLLRFDDPDKGDCVFYDEREALELWERARGSWCCTLFQTVRVPAPAGDGEAEKLAADIAEATGCDNPRYNVGFTAKINRTIGFWRGVVAALRRAQPPQPTGDVGELADEIESYLLSSAGDEGGRQGIALMVRAAAALRSANSRLAALSTKYEEECDDHRASLDLLTNAETALAPFAKQAAFYENSDGGVFIQARLAHSGLTATEFCTVDDLRRARGIVSPTEPAGRGG